MIYKELMKPSLEDFGREGTLTEHALLRMLENISCYHSDSLGLGAMNREETSLAWLLLEWRLQLLSPMYYGKAYEVSTWSRGALSFCTTLRDFEIRDESGALCLVASSKWTPVNAKTKKLLRITDELLCVYGTEEKAVFGGDILNRLREPEAYDLEVTLPIRRGDFDLNAHVHNLCYLDFAMEALPDEVYRTRAFHDIRITYRKELGEGETQVIGRYAFSDGIHTVSLFGCDGVLRAIITLS